MSTWSLQWRWNSHQSKALVSGDTYKQCTVMHCKYAFWAWGFSRKKCQFNVNWDVKIGAGVSLWCNYIMWGGGMGAVDCPGPRWIGCRIKGSPILTTRAQSHTCKGQRKEIHPLLLEIFESTTSIQNVATFWRPKPLHIGVTLALLLCFIIPQKIVITLINSSWSEPASAGRTSFYLFGKQSKFVGEVFAHKVYLDLV